MSTSQYVDIAFPARGRTVPRDHGYALHGALSGWLPIIHGADWLAYSLRHFLHRIRSVLRARV